MSVIELIGPKQENEKMAISQPRGPKSEK